MNKVVNKTLQTLAKPLEEIAKVDGPLALSETFAIVRDSFMSHKVRTMLTALGMVIGSASLILVVTIAMSGRQFVLDQIQAIGSNMIYAQYDGTEKRITEQPQDFLTIADMDAVLEQVNGIRAATPLIVMNERIPVGSGVERDVMIIGALQKYQVVRNLKVLAGRFFDENDNFNRNKVAVITEAFAKKTFGGQSQAIGHTLRVSGLSFVIIGTFKEGVETFGQSEIGTDSIIIPLNVARFFTPDDTVKQIFFTMNSLEEVPRATKEIKHILQSRHRAESSYSVSNLAELMKVASKAANSLTVVLLLVAMVTLVVGGVGIMNIMLANVSQRIREIGIRKAVGATRRDIQVQFLMEAVTISAVGGAIGSAIGLALPFSVRQFTDFQIPISPLSVFVAMGVAVVVGVVFGTAPASRAAKQEPVLALHNE